MLPATSMAHLARKLWRPLAGWTALTLVLGLVSCRDPTQIVLRVRSDSTCAERQGWRGIAVRVGKPGPELERQAPTLVTTRCEADGDVGSLVVVPSGDKDEEVGIVVVAGVEREPEECLSASYLGCIVARRRLRFSPHRELEVSIDLVRSCLSVGCRSSETCVDESCVDSAAPTAVPKSTGDPFVRCGDEGTYCETDGEVCCLTVDVEGGRSRGDCRRPDLCLLPSIVLRCDDDTDCPVSTDGGPPFVCALSYRAAPETYHSPDSISHSECRRAADKEIGGSTGLALCEDKTSCGSGAFPCEEASALLPRYHWCRLIVQ